MRQTIGCQEQKNKITLNTWMENFKNVIAIVKASKQK